METQEQSVVDKNVIAQDFVARHTESLGAEKANAVANSIKAAETKYPAKGTILGVLFYTRITVNIDGGKGCVCNGGGFSGIGGGALFGDVYTDDINRLYRDTVSFEFNAAAAYTSVIFFDKDSNRLGHYQSGSLSTIIGIGGGSCSWS